MKNRIHPHLPFVFLVAFLGAGLLLPAPGRAADAAPPVSLVIQADQAAGKVSPMHSGLMIEEINHSLDGGLYAELIQNRAFKDGGQNPVHWALVQDGGASASIAIDAGHPLSDALTSSLRLDVAKASPAQRVGVANDGYWGIPVKPATTYRASFYADANPGFDGPVTVSIESVDGATVYAKAQVPSLAPGWHPYAVTLVTGNVTPTAKARFVLAVDRPGTVWFDLVSLFPPTWNNRPNGLRPDLMQMLVDLKPAFLRCPVGNYLEGATIPQRFEWKKTLGPLTSRAGHPGPWGYRSSDGLGLLEYMLWCEDMGAEPVLAVYAGYSLDGTHVNPGPDLQPYVQDALDEIEYVTGPVTSQWGAQRAKDGHPAPFPLHYVEIGNEDWFDKTHSYNERYAQINDDIKAQFPALLCISTVGNEQPADRRVTSTRPDTVDEHYYRAAKDFEKMAPTWYDKYDRSGPAIFVGEWAAYEDIIPWDRRSAVLPRTPSMKAALADAAWMTGMERNSDFVKLQSYAPLLVNVNPGASQWRPNLIGYDALHAFGSPSYYAILMFNQHRGDTILKGALDAPGAGTPPPIQYSVTKDSKSGMIHLKLVNINAAPQPVSINLKGIDSIAPIATATTLAADSLTDTNSIDEPTKVVPVVSKLQDVKPEFTYTLPPYSLTVLDMWK